ncbi:MAG: TlpA family protein disulfide reductase [Vulcanimicrobiaceae bacterium]
MLSERAKLGIGCVAAWLAAFGIAAAPGVLRGPADAAEVAQVGHAPPHFLLDTPSGGTISLADFTGKPVVFNLFASWCPPCRQELPLLVGAARHNAGKVTFVGVDEQEPAVIALSFARQLDLPYRIALDSGQFEADIGAAAIPETVFIDAHGIVRAIQHGPLTADLLAKDLAAIGAPQGSD